MTEPDSLAEGTLSNPEDVEQILESVTASAGDYRTERPDDIQRHGNDVAAGVFSNHDALLVDIPSLGDGSRKPASPALLTRRPHRGLRLKRFAIAPAGGRPSFERSANAHAHAWR